MVSDNFLGLFLLSLIFIAYAYFTTWAFFLVSLQKNKVNLILYLAVFERELDMVIPKLWNCYKNTSVILHIWNYFNPRFDNQNNIGFQLIYHTVFQVSRPV